jgi:CPA2 family monovalent cation:H+ antiporter-2
MAKRRVVVIATGNLSISRELSPLVQERLPDIERVIALPGPEGLEEFNAMGMMPVDINTSGGSERIIDMVFTALGKERRLPVSSLTNQERAEARSRAFA